MPEPETAAPETVKRVPLTDTEAGVLNGLSVAKLHAQRLLEGINEEIVAYQNAEIAKRLGIHASLFVQFNPVEKWISVRSSDAPKGDPS